MELSHVTSVLLVTMAMTFAVTCALPYRTLFEAEPANLDDRVERFPADYGNELGMLRRLVAYKLMRRELNTQDEQNDQDSRIAKRMNFALGGLDTLDHVTNILDEKIAERNQKIPKLPESMRRHQGKTYSTLKAMMESAG